MAPASFDRLRMNGAVILPLIVYLRSMKCIVNSIGVLALAASIGACMKAEPRACKPPRAHWLNTSDLGYEIILNRVSLNQNGQTFWNGSPVSHDQLVTMLKETIKRKPSPILQLNAEMGVSCRELELVRDKIDKTLDCAKETICREGGIDGIPDPPSR